MTPLDHNRIAKETHRRQTTPRRSLRRKRPNRHGGLKDCQGGGSPGEYLGRGRAESEKGKIDRWDCRRRGE